jgi:hypothetical protein
MRDFLHSVVAKRAISSTRVTDNTAQVSQIIDMQGFEAALFTINIGTVADADTTIAALLEEGDAANLSDAATVANADMISLSTRRAADCRRLPVRQRQPGAHARLYRRQALHPPHADPVRQHRQHGCRRHLPAQPRRPQADGAGHLVSAFLLPPWTKARPLRAAPPLSP